MPLEVLKCPNCAAPLNPSVAGQVIVCDYCGRSVSGLAMRAPAPLPPAAPPAAPPQAAPVARPAAAFDWSEDSVLALAKRHLGVGDSRYFSPHIPASKEKNAREMHKASLPEGERVLVLFDDTVFGAADDGFVLTTRRVCWHNILEDPYAVAWADLDPEDVRLDDDEVVVAHGTLQLTQVVGDKGFKQRVVKLFRELASHARRR
ncbi:MAG: hypothetical protein R3A52_31870 [Polyangiales bacterium]